MEFTAEAIQDLATRHSETLKQEAQNHVPENKVAENQEPEIEKPATTEEVKQPEVAEEVKKEEAKPETEAAGDKEKKDDFEILEFEDAAVTAESAPEYLKDFSAELGQEFKTVGELKEHIKTLKSNAESTYANDVIKKLNDYAKEGGDIQDIIQAEGNIAKFTANREFFVNADNKDLVEIDLTVKYQKGNPNLKPEEVAAKVAERIERMSDEDLEDRALEIRPKLISETETAIANIQKQTESLNTIREEKRAKAVESMTNALKSWENAYTFTTPDGKLKAIVKVDEASKASMREYEKNPNAIIREFFPQDKNGLPIAEQWRDSAYKLKNFEREVGKAFQKGKSMAQKQAFKEGHNIPDKNVDAQVQDKQNGKTQLSQEMIDATIQKIRQAG